MSKITTTTLQPADVFKKLGVAHTDDHTHILDLSLRFLVYLRDGEKLRVGGITYTKLDEHTVHIGNKINAADVSDALASKRNIRIMI